MYKYIAYFYERRYNMSVIHIIFSERGETMVEIKRIKVDGYKNVSNVDIELKKITSLLSINSYGKSNLLQAIDFGLLYLSATINQKVRLMNWTNGMPLLEDSLNKNFKFEIEFSLEQNKTDINVIYGYEFKWGISKSNPSKVVAEYLRIKNLDESQKYSKYIDRTEKVAYIKSSEKGRCDKKINSENHELLINKLYAYDHLFYFRIIRELNNIDIYNVNIDRSFDSSNQFKALSLIKRGHYAMSSSDSEGIAERLYYIKKRYPEKFLLIKNAFMDLFPFIEDLRIEAINLADSKYKSVLHDKYEIQDVFYSLRVKHKNLIKPIIFNDMSDGAKKILLLLTYLVMVEISRGHIIAIEEPENSINPGLLKRLLMILDGITEKAKIIITSHSPFLINYIDLSTLYLGVPNDDGKAIFRKIKINSVNKIISGAEEQGMLTGEYLFDLMSGSDDDITELKKYLENE